jgi:CheY-like chemotaxis protein
MSEDLKILVVDDEEIILNIFKEYLESNNNYTVLTAGDGLDALEIIKKEEINCCFTDISMPRMDGVELTERIQAYDNTIPVVVMTGFPSMDSAINTLKNGVVDFLTKPIKMDQIPLAIERVMRGRSLFVDNILLKEEAKRNERLLKINQELKQKIKEVETMNLILQQLDQVTTSKDLFNILVDLSGEVTTCDEAHFCISGQGLTAPLVIASFFRDKDRTVVGVECIEEGIIRKVAYEGIPLLKRENDSSHSIMAIPLKIRSRVFGILISLIRDASISWQKRHLS